MRVFLTDNFKIENDQFVMRFLTKKVNPRERIEIKTSLKNTKEMNSMLRKVAGVSSAEKGKINPKKYVNHEYFLFLTPTDKSKICKKSTTLITTIEEASEAKRQTRNQNLQ